MTIHKITDHPKLDKLLKKHGKCVIKFTAAWCGPCRRIGPLFKSLSQANSDIRFIEIDIDEADESITQKYKVTSLPCFVAINQEHESGRLLGANDDSLKTLVSSLILL